MAIERIAPADIFPFRPTLIERLCRRNDPSWEEYAIHLAARAMALPGGHLKRIVWDEEGGYPAHAWGYEQLTVRPYVQGFGCDGTTDRNIHRIAQAVCDQLGLDYRDAFEEAYPSDDANERNSGWLDALREDADLAAETVIPEHVDADVVTLVLSDLYQINNRSLVTVLAERFKVAGFETDDWWAREDDLRRALPEGAPLAQCQGASGGALAVAGPDGIAYPVRLHSEPYTAGTRDDGTPVVGERVGLIFEAPDGTQWRHERAFPSIERSMGANGDPTYLDRQAQAEHEARHAVATSLFKGLDFAEWQPVVEGEGARNSIRVSDAPCERPPVPGSHQPDSSPEPPTMSIDPNTKTVIAKMTREEIVRVLEEQGGYQCYDSEPTDDLRNTLLSDIESGDCEYDLSAFEATGSDAPGPRW